MRQERVKSNSVKEKITGKARDGETEETETGRTDLIQSVWL
jgi:hypothetical protein